MTSKFILDLAAVLLDSLLNTISTVDTNTYEYKFTVAGGIIFPIAATGVTYLCIRNLLRKANSDFTNSLGQLIIGAGFLGTAAVSSFIGGNIVGLLVGKTADYIAKECAMQISAENAFSGCSPSR